MIKQSLLIIIFFLGFKTVEAQIPRGPFPPGERPQFPDSERPRLRDTSEQIFTFNYYGEIFGNGIYYSINYELMYKGIGARLGASFVPVGIIPLPHFPMMLTFNLGKSEHKFETSLGIVALGAPACQQFFGMEKDDVTVITAAVGYRYQPKKDGIMFRVGATPFLVGGKFGISGGISVGGTTAGKQ